MTMTDEEQNIALAHINKLRGSIEIIENALPVLKSNLADIERAVLYRQDGGAVDDILMTLEKRLGLFSA